MEGRASTFEKVLADFESRLPTAEFVAIDTELTGVDIEGEPDTFEESAAVRLEKICRIAERYSLIQLGLTLVGQHRHQGLNGNTESKLWCASYNLFAFPYVGQGELAGGRPGFMCQASALQFNAHHRVDFNTWIGQGIPYMSREEERRNFGNSKDTSSSDQKVGLLRLWKALCHRKLPFVVHSPLDLFFLLVAFERCPLPRGDPRALAVLIRQCTPKVYDTAHLHGAVGRFRRLGLAKFFEEAKARHDELVKTNGSSGAHPLEFELVGETGLRYSKPSDQLAHEAGFDSLLTAQLFAYLRAISPARVKEGANRLFLFRSVEYVDIERGAAIEGAVGCSMFDLTRVTLLVARLQTPDNTDAPRLIAQAGSEYKSMDSLHILVVLRASGGAAVRKAAELAAKVHGVESWMPFEEWRAERLEAQPSARAVSTSRDTASTATAEPHGRTRTQNGVDVCHYEATAEAVRIREVDGKADSQIVSGTSAEVSVRSNNTGGEIERERWRSILLRAAGVSGLLLLLALIRLRRRWRQR